MPLEPIRATKKWDAALWQGLTHWTRIHDSRQNRLNKAKIFTGIGFSTQEIIQRSKQRQKEQAEAQGQEQNLVKTFVAGDKEGGGAHREEGITRHRCNTGQSQWRENTQRQEVIWNQSRCRHQNKTGSTKARPEDRRDMATLSWLMWVMFILKEQRESWPAALSSTKHNNDWID